MTGHPTVVDVFAEEAPRTFGFLVTRYGFQTDGYRDWLVPTIAYRRDGLNLSVHLDFGDGAGTRVECVVWRDDGWTRHADLRRVVEAAGFAPMHRVAWRAHTIEALRATLADNALWVRRLLGLLCGPQAAALIERAP